MRVAIVNLTGGGLSGGYLKYLRRLVPRLRSHPGIERLDTFVPPDSRNAIGCEDGIHDWRPEDARRGFPHLKQTVRDLKPDVVFIPTASWFDFGETPVVVMVRNMEPLERPFEGLPLPEKLRNLARRTMARRACRRAARVIAVSNHVRQFVVARWGIPKDHVPIVFHGVDTDATTAGRVPSALRQTSSSEFIFTAGSIRPARGLEDLVDAIPALNARRQASIVVAGRTDPGTAAYHRTLIARARTLGVSDHIVWTGSLDEAEMTWCYRHCSAFVMTSRVEACPNVALEAMSHGCACVSADGPPMPEFFGDAALYYRPGDSVGLTRGLERLLAGGDAASALRAAASTRAREFSWDDTARRTVEVLKAAIQSPPQRD